MVKLTNNKVKRYKNRSKIRHKPSWMQFICLNLNRRCIVLRHFCFFPKPPEAISEQKEAEDENKPKDGMRLTAYINGSERIVGNMDDDARNNASRAPVEPANKDSKQHGCDKLCPKPVKRSENKGRDENGNPRTASHLQQTTKNKAAKTNLFYNGAHDTTIKCSCDS